VLVDDKRVKAFVLHIHQVINGISVASKSTKTVKSEVPTHQDPGELLVYHTLHYHNYITAKTNQSVHTCD
jgi:hypothetical protein